MKKLFCIFILLLATLAFSADVKPFYFDGIETTEQQATWDELTKYKLWGTESFSIGGNSKIPDESGRNGTNGNLTGTGNETLLGGPIYVNGDISIGMGYAFPTGPTVGNSFTMGNANNGYFGGTVCLNDTTVSSEFHKALSKGDGELTTNCTGYPSTSTLKIPNVTWPDSTLHDITVPEHGTGYIEVPEGDGPYDVYLSGITMDNQTKLYVQMPDTGRLVRVFVNGTISLGNHAEIQTMYGDSIIPNDEYAGNLLFYTNEDLIFDNTDYCIRQGTFISTKTFYLMKQVTFAGQLLATNLVIGENVDGKYFLFVPFDNPTIQLGDPKTNALGNFKENDLTVDIPIFLDTLAPVKVTFNYCFVLNESATIEDFNTDMADIPVCGESEGKVVIAEGTSIPETPVKVNVKVDDINEGTEVVGFKIYNVSGASLPGNKKTHIFTLTLEDGDYVNTAPVIDRTDTIRSLAEQAPLKNGVVSVGKVNVTDDDTTKLVFTIEEPTALFTVDSNGVIYSNHVFDYETEDTTYHVLIKVSDGEFEDTCTYVIKITNVQEDLTITSTIGDIYELNNIGDTVGVIIGKDADSTKVSYTLKDVSKTFTIDENGIITATKVLDFETQSAYPVTVTATSTDGSKKDTTFTIKVLNVNEPVHVKDTVFAINENLKGTIGKVTAWDEDDDKIYYSLSDTVKYSISDGKLVVKVPFDYETTKADTIKVYVEDGNNQKDSAVVIINVKNVNEPLHIDSVSTVVPENSPINTVLDTIHGYDEDGEPITYTVIGTDVVIKDSVIYLNTPVDYETSKGFDVKVIASTKDDKDTITIHVGVTNVNEPVHVKDTTLTIPENTTGEVGKVTAWDEDNDKITYTVLDTTKYSIDSNGVLTVKVPFDYESQTSDSVVVIVTDGTLYDTTTVKIKITNEIETSTAEIISTETRDSIWHSDTVYTNGPNISIIWKADSTMKFKDTTVHEGPNVIKLCYSDPSKDAPACDNVVVFMSTAAPIVTVAKVDVKDEAVNGVTIVEEQEKTDKNIYVNQKSNEIQVTVKDTVTNTIEQFTIKVELDTISIPKKTYQKYEYLLDENSENLKITYVGENKQMVSETVRIDGQDVTIYYYADSTGKKLDTLQHITYTTTVKGKEVTITYDLNEDAQKCSDYKVSYTTKDEVGNDIQISYVVDDDGDIVKNSDGGIGYTVSYTYTNKYGNTGTSEVFIAYDVNPPKVQILSPEQGISWYQNSIEVIWTVDGFEQDTLNLERLENGYNRVIRMYKDKYGNIGADTVYLFMKNAKDIEVKVVNPVTKVDQDVVDNYYFKGNTYHKDSIKVNVIVPDEDEPEVVGVAFKVDVVLPSISSTGGLATLDDMIQTVNSKSGILVDKSGNLKSGTSTGADGSYTISVDKYIDEHCDDTYKREFNKNGLEHTTVWDVEYNMHMWIYTTTSNYVNDYNIKYKLDDTNNADEAGILHFYLDIIPDKDGNIKSAEGKALGTGAYITKFDATSISKLRCDMPDKKKGEKVKKTEYDLTTFGYKRPTK